MDQDNPRHCAVSPIAAPPPPQVAAPPPPAPPLTAQPRSRARERLAITGLVLGAVGLALSVLALSGILAWPLGPLGLALACALGLGSSGTGLPQARSGRATNRNLALAGLACSGLGLLGSIAYAATLVAAPAGPVGLPGDPVSAAGARPSATVGQGTELTAAGIGRQQRDRALTFVVSEVRTGVARLDARGFAPEPQGAYTVVRVTATNTGTQPQLWLCTEQKLVDARGRVYAADPGAAGVGFPGSGFILRGVEPGAQVDGVLVFDLPEDARPAAIELHESRFSRGARVALGG